MDVPYQELEKMKIKELRKERFRLLDDIHEKQQQLDQIDYQIYQKKNYIKLFKELLMHKNI